ncbi:MAG: DNA mismatch repair endonuclease MutL [Saprospiraceae bacterium]|nr:DNA mismatch repair endonuclease MutL [Saprospiraceae bacterium]
MTDVIQLLPDVVANKIAAGEVIVRPASVVKELMENAIDAGATSVKLIVKDAGSTLIQVIDNGRGMSETDARMCFERHATSKIRNAEDIFDIRTMGFRGEALASIAAVAQVEMRTRRPMDELGTRIVIEESEAKIQEVCQCPVGTNVSVKNLFYNVPARRNFLKSSSVESRHILDEFQRIALAYPELAFSMHHNNSEIFHLPTGNLRQRITYIFGNHCNKKLVPIIEETETLRLSGFVGKPEYAKKTRGEQLFFVNRRFIKSGYLHHSVMGAYEDLLPQESFPLYVIFIDINPKLIDVNVHPTKQEIKFEDERLIYNYLRVTIRHALGRHSITPSLDFDDDTAMASVRIGAGLSNRIDTESNSFTLPSKVNKEMDEQARRQQSNLENWEKLYANLASANSEELLEELPTTLTVESEWSNQFSPGEPAKKTSQQKEPYQVHGSYIVSHIKSGFLLIDQQAAHERILYEQYLKILQEQTATTQKRLFPSTLTLSPAEGAMLKDMLEEVNQLGFDIQEFGGNTFLIHGVPSELADNINESNLIEALLDQYKNNLALKLKPKENIARAMAKSAAIKRGQALTSIEMQSLIDRLFACELPYKSPTGRNCFITFELDELEKRFG